MSAASAPAVPRRLVPMRTCVGCRACVAQSQLLRVFVDYRADVHGDSLALAPDPRARSGGRGAYVHAQDHCLQQARKRRAWSRALRVSAPVDDTALMHYVHSVEPAASSRA